MLTLVDSVTQDSRWTFSPSSRFTLYSLYKFTTNHALALQRAELRVREPQRLNVRVGKMNLTSSDSEGFESEDEDEQPLEVQLEVEVQVGEAAPANSVLDDAPPQVYTASPPLHATVTAPPPLHAAPSSSTPRAAHRKRQAPVMEPSDDDSESDDDSGVGAGQEGSSGGGGGGGSGDGGDGGGGAGPSEACAAAVEPRVTEEQGYARASHRAQGITQQRRPLMSLRERRRLTNRYTLALSSSNKTGYRGVFTNKSVSRPFTAEVKLRGEKRKSLGSFATSVEAAP